MPERVPRRRRARAAAFAVALCGVLLAGMGAAAAETLRIGVLQYGTVSWELDVIARNGLDRANGVEIEVVPFATTQATKVALQGGAVDVVVSDWLWVSRQRAAGADFTFVPYSTALGAVMVPAGSPIRSFADLAGKRLGIAGGPLDKSWLLLRALSRERGGDLDGLVEKVFGAPPLLSQQIIAGRIDAVLTFWHYAARLKAAGFRRVIGVNEIAFALGVGSPVPFIGYVFSDAFATERADDIRGFILASHAARKLLRDSDAEWARLAPLMRAKNEATRRALRAGFRAGIPQAWSDIERTGIRRLFAVLADIGGSELVGSATELQPGTLWPVLDY